VCSITGSVKHNTSCFCRFTDGEPVKTFSCEEKGAWTPTAVVPDCVSEGRVLMFLFITLVVPSLSLRFDKFTSENSVWDFFNFVLLQKIHGYQFMCS
jgi:hypothetical protein